ncbi:MAG: hypothetical protein AABX89_00125 [Candidatus Thermoplasmatota archaeon]
MMYQPKLCETHGPTVLSSLRSSRPARPVAVLTILGVADGNVEPLGAED